jgi:imidazolonepropionase-like amidohydrolase
LTGLGRSFVGGWAAALGATLLASSVTARVDRTFVLRNATLWSDGLGFVVHGTVVVRDGKIVSAGARVAVPEGARVIDVAERYVLPGLIDAQSQLGLRSDSIAWDTDEDVRPITPEMRVVDAFYPFGRDVRDARAGGITTALVLPGGKNLIGGQGALVKLAGATYDQFVMRAPAALKMSLGEEPRRENSMPRTRMGQIWMLREHLAKAKEYDRKRKAGQADVDLALQATAAVIRGELPAVVQAYRADDIMGAVRLSDDFGFRLVLAYAQEAPKVADELARRKVPVIVTAMKGLWYRLEKDTFDPNTPAQLHRAGVRIAIQVGEGNPFGESDLLLNAGYAMKGGLAEEDALRSITSWPAEIFGASGRIGRLASGLDADIIVLSGRPFDIRTRVERVFIDGLEVYTGS